MILTETIEFIRNSERITTLEGFSSEYITTTNEEKNTNEEKMI